MPHSKTKFDPNIHCRTIYAEVFATISGMTNKQAIEVLDILIDHLQGMLEGLQEEIDGGEE